MPKVLVADDDAQVRGLLRLLLQARAACEVLEAADGQAALDVARAEHPLVAVLDLNMPTLNGLEVCMRLQADASTRDITALILTGTGGDDVQGYALDAGTAGFFEKPFGTTLVCERVRQILSREAAP